MKCYEVNPFYFSHRPYDAHYYYTRFLCCIALAHEKIANDLLVEDRRDREAHLCAIHKERSVDIKKQKANYDALLNRWFDLEKSASVLRQQLDEARSTISSLQKEAQMHTQISEEMEQMRQELHNSRISHGEIEITLKNK